MGAGMKLIALCSIMAAAGLARPGEGFEAGTVEEGENLVDRRFARLPTDDELAQHWPEVAQAQAEAKAKAEAEAAALAAAEAEALAQAAAAAEAQAQAEAEAAAAAAAKAPAKTKAK